MIVIMGLLGACCKLLAQSDWWSWSWVCWVPVQDWPSWLSLGSCLRQIHVSLMCMWNGWRDILCSCVSLMHLVCVCGGHFLCSCVSLMHRVWNSWGVSSVHMFHWCILCETWGGGGGGGAFPLFMCFTNASCVKQVEGYHQFTCFTDGSCVKRGGGGDILSSRVSLMHHVWNRWRDILLHQQHSRGRPESGEVPGKCQRANTCKPTWFHSRLPGGHCRHEIVTVRHLLFFFSMQIVFFTQLPKLQLSWWCSFLSCPQGDFLTRVNKRLPQLVEIPDFLIVPDGVHQPA